MPTENQFWEYRVLKSGSLWSGVKADELEQKLNELGQEGWEVVSAVSFESTNKITVIAKRPLSERARRSHSLS
jgi:hypothetical protein